MHLHTLLIALFATSLCHADKDSNIYPWGSNPNNAYKMYWKDSPNVLEDLTEFSALYIKVHRCVWSEYGLGVSYDDDGENHDGDENWYMTRYQPFRANAAFSLYGTLRSGSSFGRNCRKKTYINTFFTYLGADSLLKAVGDSTTAFPDSGYGSAYCYEVQNEESGSGSGSGSGDHRRLSGSGSGDGGGESTTMGCSEDGDFVLATFDGDDCDGSQFLNGTEEYLDDYNKAMDDQSCTQVWNYRKYATRRLADGNNDDGDDVVESQVIYGSPAEYILASSFACDIDLFPEQCPDPYGLKAMYSSNLKASARRNKPVKLILWQQPLRMISWLFLFIAAALWIISYYADNRRRIKSRGVGAVRGMALCAADDTKEWGTRMRALMTKPRRRKSDQDASPDSRGRKKKKGLGSRVKAMMKNNNNKDDAEVEQAVSGDSSRRSRGRKSRSKAKKPKSPTIIHPPGLRNQGEMA